MAESALAHQVTAVLIPALPYLLGKMGEEGLKEAGKRLGGETWELAKVFWSRLGPRIKGQPAAEHAVEAVAKHPQDTDAQGALRLQIREILSDSALADELTRLIKTGKQTGKVNTVKAEKRGAAAGRDLRDNIIIHGNRNRVSKSGRSPS